MRYRKKPVITEVWEFTREMLKKSDSWVRKYPKELTLVSQYAGEVVYIEIETPKGTLEADLGDFLIKGVQNEFYPCKPDIFEQTYEKDGAVFKKRPVDVEAFQLTLRKSDREPDWFLKQIGDKIAVEMGIRGTRWYVFTLEGKMEILKNDWVVMGIQGEMYPVSPDVFEQTYDRVSE